MGAKERERKKDREREEIKRERERREEIKRERERERNRKTERMPALMDFLFLFLLFCLDSYGMVAIHTDVGLPLLVNLFYDNPHRHT
jgi:hypothetical protein